MVRWGLYRDRGNWVIRKGKERLKTSQFRAFRDDEAELKKFVLRLNAEGDARKRVEIKHAFISPELRDEYKDFLIAQIPTKRNALCEFQYLESYFLLYFIGKLNLENPLDWHKVHETKWATFLMGKEVPGSAKTKRAIIQAANRFMQWLHRKRPGEVPALEFKPLSRAKFKEIESTREMKGETKERLFIPDPHWKIISKSLPDNISPMAWLAYSYGLRRSEALGLIDGDTKKGHLSVERQLTKFDGKPLYGPLKGRTARKVPHWFCKPEKAYNWTQQVKENLMHPDTLTDRWNELMETLKLPYDFHDLRHTFITRAARVYKKDLLAVRDAAGHVDIKTTQGYLHDLPTKDDEEFEPEAA